MCNWSESHDLNGREDGEIEGKHEEKKQTILEMLNDGVAEKLIMKYTRCTKRQIDEARSCLN